MADTIPLDGAAGLCYGDCLEASVSEREKKAEERREDRGSGGAGSELPSVVQRKEQGGKRFVGSE